MGRREGGQPESESRKAAEIHPNTAPLPPASAMEAADAFASFLAAQGIGVEAPPRPERAAPGAAALAQVQSPPLGDLVEWMLIESNNDIAEALARQVAIATGRPASFGGGAAAVRAVPPRLGAAAGIHTVDGSGLSPPDPITPAPLAPLI